MSVSSFLHVYAGDDFGLYTNPPVFASRANVSHSGEHAGALLRGSYSQHVCLVALE
jgi:hypothetical protein